MTIPPEIVLAATVAIVSFLGATAAVFRFAPNYLQKRIDLSLETQAAKIKDETSEKNADIEERHAISTLLLAMSGNLEALTRAFVGQQAAQGNTANEIRANTQAITSITEQNQELNKQFNQLLDTGSKPLQDLHGKIDQLRREVIGTIATREEDKARLEKVITDATEVITSSTLIVKLAQEKLADVKRKTDSQSIPVISPSSVQL